jgi:signal transduction histidine kinase
VVVQVDDDGPGFGAGSPGTAALGLGIVQDLVSATGGELDIHPGAMGGCCVHLRLPSVPGWSVVRTGGA